MSRNEEFFHGSNHAFKVGDLISPDHDAWGEGEVHATNDPHWASTFGDHLYRVHPVGTPTLAQEYEGQQHWVSRDGYRVVDAMPWEGYASRYRKNWGHR